MDRRELARAAQEIIKSVLDRPEPERAEYLRQACDGRPRLRAEVDSLFDALERAGGFLETPAVVERLGSNDVDALVGQTVGGFRIVAPIASGGMGTVFEAEQTEPRRRVALKVMSSSIRSRSALRRFKYESEVLGRLHHGNVAQIYGAGTYDDGSGGVPWFAMEYVENASAITTYAEENGLRLDARLELFADVCDAVHHGHQNGIIHRDLKPGNVLVDGDGIPRVIDFGIARTTDVDVEVTTLQTDIGHLIGTLQYMSPEQYDADPAAIDIRSDVYALGLLLYELVCGRRPYDLATTNIYEAARIVREEPPPRPRTLEGAIPADVETIILKAIEKDRDRRYTSADAIRQDVERFRQHEPIAARPPSVMYRVGRFARRNTAVCVASASAVLALVAAVIVSVSFAVGASRDRDAAVWREYVSCLAAADAAARSGNVGVARRRLEAAPEVHRGWEWAHMMASLDASRLTLAGHQRLAVGVGFIDATTCVSTCLDGQVRWWDTRTGRTLERRDLDEGVRALAVDANGGVYVLHASRLRRIDASGTLDREVALSHGTNCFAVAPCGSSFAVGMLDGSVILVRGFDAEPLRIAAHDGRVDSVAFSPDGARLASCSALDTAIRVWSVADATSVAEVAQTTRVSELAWHPNGRHLAVGSAEAVVTVWETSSWTTVATLHGHRERILDLAYGPLGAVLVSTAADNSIIAWSTATGERERTFVGHASDIVDVAVSLDGREIASSSADRAVRLWSIDDDPTTIALPASVVHLGAGHGTNVIVHADDGVRSVDPVTGVLGACLFGGERFNAVVAYDGGFVTGHADGMLKMWDLAADAVGSMHAHQGPIVDVAVTQDGSFIASASPVDSTIFVRHGAASFRLEGHEAGVISIALVGEHEPRLLSGSRDGTARLWNLDDGSCERVFDHDSAIYSVALHADRGIAVVGDYAGRVTVHDIEGDDGVMELGGHGGMIVSLAISADGTRLFAGVLDSTIHVWDLDYGVDLLVLHEEFPPVALVLADEGRQLLSAHPSFVRVWDTRSPRERFAERDGPVKPGSR